MCLHHEYFCPCTQERLFLVKYPCVVLKEVIIRIVPRFFTILFVSIVDDVVPFLLYVYNTYPKRAMIVWGKYQKKITVVPWTPSCSRFLWSFADIHANQLTFNICSIQLWALKVNADELGLRTPPKTALDWIISLMNHFQHLTVIRPSTCPSFLTTKPSIQNKTSHDWSAKRTSYSTLLLVSVGTITPSSPK